jgi:hypothetical protein
MSALGLSRLILSSPVLIEGGTLSESVQTMKQVKSCSEEIVTAPIDTVDLRRMIELVDAMSAARKTFTPGACRQVSPSTVTLCDRCQCCVGTRVSALVVLSASTGAVAQSSQ